MGYFKTIAEIETCYGKKSKHTSDGLIAVEDVRAKVWRYFRWQHWADGMSGAYIETGSTLEYQRA